MALTIKQENFCKYYIETGNATAAYEQAYDAENMKKESIHDAAYKLTKNHEVAMRINELKEQVRSKLTISLETITQGILDAIEIATIRFDSANMIKGQEALSKLYGIGKEQDTKNIFTEAQRKALLSGIKSRLLENDNDKIIDITP